MSLPSSSTSCAGLSVRAGNILIVGSINADLQVHIDRLPLVGETLSANRLDSGQVMPGGKGANQAVRVAALLPSDTDRRVYWVGRLGNDSHADMLSHALGSFGVDTSLSERVSVPSGQAIILRQKGGENSIILIPAANHSWPSSLPSSLTSAIASASLIMLQREIPEAVNIQVAQAAKSAAVPVFLDMGGEDSPIAPTLIRSLTLLSANETELARLAGRNTGTVSEAIDAAAHVQSEYGLPYILVTLGELGSFLRTSTGEVIQCSAVAVDDIVDTTGAGDCFRAAFSVAYLCGQSWSDCLSFASHAAAIAIQHEGAMSRMPNRERVENSMGKGGGSDKA